ncbi:hypothetical protein OG884_19500 [Streptosporangium sp. NBC_01755]|nr:MULTISPECIES: hypothetical protein [unclassified Streptosporangium]WSA24822.1 hypothetical protein OIE13_28395 [Streptosporangium sp. NBC_01810]WSD03995.1 hypothetical protein OG884_19500 [Streptosporangium sp. NBC_01755]
MSSTNAEHLGLRAMIALPGLSKYTNMQSYAPARVEMGEEA